ncbi:hypothetical protein YPPY47_4599, partial [Yersinia pestis PY-47]
MGLAAA